MALKYVVFLGTTRENRLGERVAKYFNNVLKGRGHSVTYVDPAAPETPFPLLKKPLHFYRDADPQPPSYLTELNEKIKAADAILVISGEYNHSIPPALSNAMDHFPGSSYAWKPSGIVSYSPGGFGGVRAAMQLRAFLGEVGAISVSNICSFSKVHEMFDADGKPNNEDSASRIERNANTLLNQLDWWAEAASNQRNSKAPPR